MLKPIKRLLYPVTSRYLCTAMACGGVLRGTGRQFRCLFVDNSLFTQYLIPKMFEGPIQVKRKWKVLIPRLRGILESQAGHVDLCIAVIPARHDAAFEGRHLAATREFVLQEIDTTPPWEELVRRFHDDKKRVSRRISRLGVDYRLSHEPRELELFYRRMYLPHVAKFAAAAGISSLESMQARLASGFLLFVMEQGEAVAGAFCTLEDARLVCRWAGVLDGDERHVRSGAQMAVDYALLEIARQRGCRALDLQRSRPFLTDGVYQAKRSWGASVHPDPESEGSRLYFFADAGSALVPHFLERHPLIIHTGQGLRGLIGQPDLDDRVPPSRAKELIRRYRSPGLAGLTVMTGTGQRVEIS